MNSSTTLLTVGEAAERLRVSPKTVYRRISAGQIPAVKLGESPKAPLRIDPRELNAWVYASP